jgi:ketosteroid isomerase-like protein
MLKKILLPLLMAAVVLPQSVSAAIAPNGTSQARGMVAAQNSLSVSDQKAIEKLISALVKAGNDANHKESISYFSRKYEFHNGDQLINYQTMKESIRTASVSMKSHGMKMVLKDIKFVNTTENAPQAEVEYGMKIDLATGGKITNRDRETAKRIAKRIKGKFLYTFTKENGRWLIVSVKPLETFRESAANAVATDTASAPAKNQQQERKVLQALFKKHIQALNKEDLQAYLATLDPKSAQYKEAQTQTQKLFKEYDLKYEVETIEVISIGQQNAVVKMVATVKKIKGGSFTNSKIIAYNTLRKTSEGWRIADTQIESVSALASR